MTILTEEDFKNKMVVVFAGYAGEMQILLDKVNPGLKSRVSEVVDFPNFDHVDAAEIAAGLLEGKRLDVSRVPRDLLAAEARRLVAAPRWANGRDVEAWCRRVAVECATRGDAAVSLDAISAAADFIIAQKAPAAAVQPPVVDPDLSSLFLAEDAVAAPPSVDVGLQTNADQNDDDGDSGGAGPLEDYDGALECGPLDTDSYCLAGSTYYCTGGEPCFGRTGREILSSLEYQGYDKSENQVGWRIAVLVYYVVLFKLVAVMRLYVKTKVALPKPAKE